MKLNVDAACRLTSRGSAKSQILATPLSSLLLETRAILEGLLIAISLQSSRIQVESDSLQVIKLINEEVSSMRDELSWIMEIRSLASHFSLISFSHIYRGGNVTAHTTAKFGLSTSTTCFWQHQYPTWLLSLTDGDFPSSVIQEAFI